MVNRCNATGCYTNYPGHDSGSVFSLPKDENLRKSWIKFLNRKNVESLKNIFLCEKHFESKYLKKNENRVRLVMTSNPIPTVFSDSQSNLPKSLLPTLVKPRKEPFKRVYQEDQLAKFRQSDIIKDFKQIDESMLKDLGSEFTFVKHEDYVLFYKIIFNYLGVPQVAECIRINSDLRIQLFYKGVPIRLPTWFRQGRDSKLTFRSILQNFPAHIKQETEKQSDISDELQQLKYKKCPIYSANLIRYALILRYTSLPSYKLLMEEFKLPSLSFLKKLSSGKIDAISSVKMLREKGKISSDIILIFDEIYLQKCEEFSGGESFGADESGCLYKGMVCFMIIGLKNNIPYVIKACPENEINGEWLKDQLIDSLEALQANDFNVRGIVCDNHASNVSAYKKLLAMFATSVDDLAITFNCMTIYLFFDAVHLMKNLRNNLLNRKRFLFPEFYSDSMLVNVTVRGGEIRWGLFHKVYEKDQSLQANLKAAPKLTANVLHPGNCKQSVPVALAIFDPTTFAAIRRYFPENSDSAEFLNLFYVWWTISNSKEARNTRNLIGSAAIKNDGKPQFLRDLASWIEVWDELNIPNTKKCTLSAQTSSAMKRTLRCQAALIEDLLSDGFDFVLTARLQSDHRIYRYIL